MVTNNSSNIPTGVSGTVLQGQGAGNALALSTATYPSVATGTGKILRADGTNWTPTTATFPDLAGASGNVMTSDGTNWTSAANTAGGGLLSASGTLTNSQIKNLRATPIELIPAPGAGKTIFVVSATLKLSYGGTNVFVAGAGLNVCLRYSGIALDLITGVTGQWFANGSIAAAANRVAMYPGSFLNAASDSAINVGLVAINTGGSEISGNAANDNVMPWNIIYYILTI